MTLTQFKKTNAHNEGCSFCGDEIQPESNFLWYGNPEGDAVCDSCTFGMK